MIKVEPIEDLEWDTYLEVSPYSTFFHTSFWKNSVINHLGGEARFFICSNEKRKWLVPVYLGKWSKGFRIGAIGYGGPLPLEAIADPNQEKAAIKDIIRKLETLIGLPCTDYVTYPMAKWDELLISLPNFLTQTHLLCLEGGQLHVFENVLSGNVRTAIRRSAQYGLEARLASKTDLFQAHCLLAKTQQQVGASYTTPYSLLDQLFSHSEKGIELWVCFDKFKEMISMSLMLHYRQHSIHYLHGWDRSRSPPGANQALLWSMIKRSIELGSKTFNFGESPNLSLKQAKERWGAKQVPILRGTCSYE